MLPLTAGVIIMGPISGWLSDKYGPRWIATIGMVITTLAFLVLASLPYNFQYFYFGLALFLMGVGNGMFGSPNSASIMNSVPAQDRGVASGMMTTVMNTAFTASMAMFFTIVIVGITQRFPAEMTSSLLAIGADKLAPIIAISHLLELFFRRFWVTIPLKASCQTFQPVWLQPSLLQLKPP